jgi:hypothetical protein
MDMEKLETFIQPVIRFRSRVEGVTKYINEPMRRCTPEDFEQRGLSFAHEEDRVKYSYRLCPNWERL